MAVASVPDELHVSVGIPSKSDLFAVLDPAVVGIMHQNMLLSYEKI